MGRILVSLLVVWGSVAFADGEKKSLCEQMVEAAQRAQPIAPFELGFVQGKNSQSIVAFETEGEGLVAWEIEYVLTGFNNQILRIKAYRRNKALNFNDADMPRILLGRVLSMNPQVKMIRETWIADELPEVIKALSENKTPLEAVQNTFRAELYGQFGFRTILKVGLDFDERDSMILFDVDFVTDSYVTPKSEPEVAALQKDSTADDKKAAHIRKLLNDLLSPENKPVDDKAKPPEGSH